MYVARYVVVPLTEIVVPWYDGGMGAITYTIELAPLENGGFAVTVPALPGCVTWGSTFNQAIAMVREAIELWLEEISELGEPIPEERTTARPVKIGVQVHRPALI
jgi:antitoxin HicB